MFNTFQRKDVKELDPKIGNHFCHRDVDIEMSSNTGEEKNDDIVGNESEVEK